jgi:hypothetical protein
MPDQFDIPNCECCDVVGCDCIHITVAGIVTGTCGCAYCDHLNKTFHLLGIPGQLGPWTASTCSTEQPYSPCSYQSIAATLTQVGSDWIFKVIIGFSAVTTRIVWQKNFGATKPTCEELAGDIPYLESIITSPDTTDTDCDATGSTLTVSIPDQSEECDDGIVCQSHPNRNCSVCKDNNNPDAIEVEIPNFWTNENCTGSQCSDTFSGIFILERLPLIGNCNYRYNDPTGRFFIEANILSLGTSSPCLRVRLVINGMCGCSGSGVNTNTWTWRVALPAICTSIDCSLGEGEQLEVPFCCVNAPGCARTGTFVLFWACKWDGASPSDTTIRCSGDPCQCPSGAGSLESIYVTAI